MAGDSPIVVEDDTSDPEVEVVTTWDNPLREKKAFAPINIILSGKKYQSPQVADMRTLLADIVKESATDFFCAGSTQAKNFNEIKKLANTGWKKESGRNKKWNCEFLADKLAMLWVLYQQASKSKQRSSARAGRSTSATSNSSLE